MSNCRCAAIIIGLRLVECQIGARKTIQFRPDPLLHCPKTCGGSINCCPGQDMGEFTWLCRSPTRRPTFGVQPWPSAASFGNKMPIVWPLCCSLLSGLWPPNRVACESGRLQLRVEQADLSASKARASLEACRVGVPERGREGETLSVTVRSEATICLPIAGQFDLSRSKELGSLELPKSISLIAQREKEKEAGWNGHNIRWIVTTSESPPERSP